MKKGFAAVLVMGAMTSAALAAHAAPPRLDVIWARSTGGAPITLDGNLNEPQWAQAESKVIRYRVDNGIPGSGWQEEGGLISKDSTYATIKFLVVGNQLYLGAVVLDKSIGGGNQFNRFDGLLMNLRDHHYLTSPAPSTEYLYGWWNQEGPALGVVGGPPTFVGAWAELPHGSPRTPAQVAAWDARTVVNGIANSDTAADVSYTIEMRFDLTVMGYDVTQPAGDIIEWNVSVYDTDYFWPIDFFKFSSNRAWWQNPWGNTGWYHGVRIHARPDVTTASGPVPIVAPDVTIPNAAGFPSPTIDGNLTEPVWASAPSLALRFDDILLRESYPGVARWRAGQYQPTVNGGQAFVADPGDATIKYFFKEDTLYLGFDVNDQVVQYHALQDRWDGFVLTINDRDTTNRDHVLLPRAISFQVGPTGEALARDFLPYLKDTLHAARIELNLKPGTTVDTLGAVPDAGYTAELAIALPGLGYPPGRGDGLLFWGVTMYDGDSFSLPSDSYGTRTWWFREREGDASSSWSYLDPATGVVGVEDEGPAPSQVALLGTFPNPFRTGTSIRFALPKASRVSLEVFDLQGRSVTHRELGVMPAGMRQAAFEAKGLGTGLYMYRVTLSDPDDDARRSTLSGKMMLVK